jgi:tetratricopeptide (TPR) repeat protein
MMEDPGSHLDPTEHLALATLAMLPPGQRRTLARCALVAGFDTAMYEAVLRDHEGPPLADLLRERNCERRIGMPGEYQVFRGLREAAWLSWWPADSPPSAGGDAPEELKAFAAEVARYCQESDRPVEALRALMIANEDEAAAWFEKVYTQWDGQLNLPGCQDLLDVLSDPERVALVGPRLAALRNDRSRYLNTRHFWRHALLASSRYLSRPCLEANLEALYKDTTTRALRVHASGGMGKSMMLRWFIAHRCVPERVPCALIDLDAVDAVNATRHPWLVLLEIAAQLNVQMERAPFQELLRERGAYREVLSPHQEDLARSGAAALGTSTAMVDARDVKVRLFSALQDGPPDEAVLVVIDTFEEAVLRPAGDPDALVECLADLLDEVPQVRLVLSGRRTGREGQLPRLEERLPPSVMADLAIPEFSPEEARGYLTEVRHITRLDVVEAIAGQAYGLPWQLALFADYVEHFPDTDPHTLKQVDPALAWCVDRIVGRLHSDALQWLLRYGVVPRRLRRDFAERVLLPHIAAGMRGSAEDRPEHDARLPGSLPVFRTGVTPPSGPEEFRAVWAELLHYAADSSSWVQMPSPSDSDTVVLHPSVVEPLRRLIASHSVYTLLHQDATRYYEGLARSDPDRWAAWTREALYHRFQIEGVCAGEAWREAVAQARLSGYPERTAEIAGEILGPEYVDEEGCPLRVPSGVPIIDAQLQVEALIERTWALARCAREQDLAGGHREWSDVERGLTEAQLIARRNPTVEVPAARRDAAWAALRLARGEFSEALDLAQPVANADEVSSLRCGALMLCAESLRALGQHAEARATLLTGREIAGALGDARVSVRMALMLVQDATERGQYDEALQWARTAASEDSGGTCALQIRFAQAKASLRMGLPATAARLADVAEPEDPDARFADVRARALLELGRPLAALELCDRVLCDQDARTGPALPRDREAWIREVRGRANAELLLLEPALDDLERAKNLYLRLRDLERAARCSAAAARLYLRGIGNLKEAEQCLDEAPPSSLREGSDAWAQCLLLRAELNGRLGNEELAVEQCREVLRGLVSPHRQPALFVAAGVQGLALGVGDPNQFSLALIRGLAAVAPATARLALLGDLERCVRPIPRAPELLELVAADVTVASEDDAAWLALRRAEAYRLAGQRREAVETATWGAGVLAASDPFAWWIWLELMERNGAATADEPVPAELGKAGGLPLLSAAHEIRLALHRMTVDEPDITASRLHRAESLLGATRTRTRWHALLHLAWSRLCAASGDMEQSHDQARRAAAVYGQLGDERAVRAPGVEHPPTEAWWRQVCVHLSSESADEPITVEVDGRTAGPLRGALLPAVRELARAIPEPVLLHSSLSLSDFLLNIHAHLELPELDIALAPGEDKPLDLRLTFEPPHLAQFPWEQCETRRGPLVTDDRIRTLYRAPSEGIARIVQTRALQRALARLGFQAGPDDGLFGPLTRRGLIDFQRSAGLRDDWIAGRRTWRALRARLVEERHGQRRPRVMVMRRSTASQLTAQRGHSFEGHDVVALYEQAGFDVLVVPDPDLEELDRLAGKGLGPIDVLHISATMEATGSAPALDFGATTYGRESPWHGSRTESLAVTPLDRFVDQFSKAGATPLVVLDIIKPRGAYETIRQLLLRNLFAQQLAGLGQVETVLAAGLGNGVPDPEASPAGSPVLEQLIEGLAQGRTVADVARSLQAVDPQVVLFSAIPPDAMLPLVT